EPVQSEAAVTGNAIIASEDVRDKIEIDAVGKAVNGIVPMDETVEFDGMTVHFTGYEFDSEYAKFYYDLIYPDKDSIPLNGLSVRPMGINGIVFCGSAGDNDYDAAAIHCHATIAVDGTPNSLRVSFGRDLTDLTDRSYTADDEVFAVTVHFDKDSALRTFWGKNIAVDEEGEKVKFRDGFITPTHIMVSVENSYGLSDEIVEKLPAAVRMKDGTRLVPHRSSFIVDTDSDTRWLIYEFDEPIDISEVEEGSFHNFYFYGEDWEETKRIIDNYDKLRDIESSPLYTPADEWFDCDGKHVHVTGYAFDTVNLRIRYETCYDEPIKKTSSAAYFYQITNVFPDNSAGCSSADISYDRAEEGIVETLQNIYATEPVDSLEVPFGDSFFSVSYNSNIPKIEREINKEVSGSVNYRFDRFVLTPYSLSFIVTDGPTDYSTEEGVAFSHAVSNFEVSINFADGSTKEMRGLVDEPSGIAMPEGKAYKFYQFLDPIDINDVVSITVNGCEIYNCERALEIGKEFALADGSKGIVNSVQYDGHVCKAEMELRSTDPEYYEHKSYKSKDDPSYSIFLGAHSTITKECGSGKIEITSDENGSVIKYTSFFVPLDKDDTLKLYIGDLTDHVERRAGYVEVPLTVPRHDPIKTVTENDEFGRWEITLSPMGFVIEKDGSDFFLDPKNTDCTVVLTDGREEAHTMLSTGHYDKYSSYEYTFGVFDAPLDLDNIQSVSLYGQTIVLGETSD
ncbi:MAG TPA: hypothetical protein DDX72_03735, partial [Ruminococcaceae bacterium]|nr:hypothetical protein [Oscillospiraceae bacterium]